MENGSNMGNWIESELPAIFACQRSSVQGIQPLKCLIQELKTDQK